jgi:hypothetical protein
MARMIATAINSRTMNRVIWRSYLRIGMGIVGRVNLRFSRLEDYPLPAIQNVVQRVVCHDCLNPHAEKPGRGAAATGAVFEELAGAWLLGHHHSKRPTSRASVSR